MSREDQFSKPYSGTRLVLWMIALALFAFQGLLPAQEVTASVLGTVTDPSGAPVAGAKVTATDVDRGAPFSTATNEVGAYNLHAPAGRLLHWIRVEHPGFNAAQQTNITLELNQAAHVDIKLSQMGDVSSASRSTFSDLPRQFCKRRLRRSGM